MFRLLARLISDPFLNNPPGTPPPNADTVFAIHPIQLSRWLEEIWANGGLASWPAASSTPRVFGDNAIVQRLKLPDGLRTGSLRSGVRPAPPNARSP